MSKGGGWKWLRDTVVVHAVMEGAAAAVGWGDGARTRGRRRRGGGAEAFDGRGAMRGKRAAAQERRGGGGNS